MATVLDTFITKFGFQTDTTGLKKAEKGLGDLKASAFKIAAAVGGILGGGFFINKIAAAADETLKFADSVGIAVEEVGKLEFAVQRQGGTTEGLRASLDNLNKSIGEVERGTGRAKLAFEDYGLSVHKSNGETKTADELLIDLNKKFTTISRAQQFDLAMKMGIDKGTIRLLQTAPDEVARLRMEAAKLGVLSRRDALKAAEFQDGLTNIAQALNGIKFTIGGLVFEPLAKFFKLMAEGLSFFNQHKDTMMKLLKVLGLTGAAFLAMGLRAAVAWILAIGPVALLVAAIAGVSLALTVLLDDVIAYSKGQQSALGDAIEQWPELEKVVDSFGEALGFVGDDLEFIWEILPKIGDRIKEFFTTPFEKLEKTFNKTLGAFGQFGDLIGLTSPSIPSLVSPHLAGAGGGGFGGPISRINTISVGDINVNAPGADSKEIVQNVKSELVKQLQNAVEDFDSSINK